MNQERRTSSNGVKSLRAIFERESSASPSSDLGRSSSLGFGLDGQDDRASGPYRRVTTSFVSVEPEYRNMAAEYERPNSAVELEDDPRSPVVGSIEEHSVHGETELDLRIAVIKLINGLPKVLLLKHTAEHGGQWEFPGAIVERDDSSTSQVTIDILRTQTGLLPVKVFDKIPGPQETVTPTSSRITFVISAVSEDVKINETKHSKAMWADKADVLRLHFLGPGVEDTVAQALKIAPDVLEASEEDSNTHTQDSSSSHENHTTGHIEAESVPKLVQSPVTNGQSEHTEKAVSSVEDADAQLQSVGITDQQVISGAQSTPGQHEQDKIDVGASLDERAAAGEVEHVLPEAQEEGARPSGNRTAANQDGVAASSQKVAPRRSNGPISATAASSSRTTAAGQPRATVREASRSSTTSQPKLSNNTTQTKTSSSARPARLSAHLTAPTAASSNRQSSSGTLGRTPSVQTKKPINTTSHLLAPTASSAARDHPPPQAYTRTTTLPDRSIGTAKRDRSSLASTTNGTLRGPQPSNQRNSSQTSAPSSSAAASRKPSGGDFLSRMTRPTAASSNRSQPETKNPLSQSTTTRPPTLNSSAIRKQPGVPTASGTLRRTAATTAAQKAKNNSTNTATAPGAQLPRLKTNGDVPTTPKANGTNKGDDMADAEGDVAHGGGEGTDEHATSDGALGQQADSVMEARMMETPDLGEAVIR